MPGYGLPRGGKLGKVRILHVLNTILARSVYCLWNREAQRQNRKQRRRDDEQALPGQHRLSRLFIFLRRFDGLCRGSLFLQVDCRFRGLWSFFLLFPLLYRIFILIGSRRLCGLRGTRLLLPSQAFGKLGHCLRPVRRSERKTAQQRLLLRRGDLRSQLRRRLKRVFHQSVGRGRRSLAGYELVYRRTHGVDIRPRALLAVRAVLLHRRIPGLEHDG